MIGQICDWPTSVNRSGAGFVAHPEGNCTQNPQPVPARLLQGRVASGTPIGILGA